MNDLFLKISYANWLTGKLSDFAGLLVFSLLLFAFFPRQVRPLSWTTCALFVWWKSPYSGAFIEAINASEVVRIARTVDYTDLIALLTIPAATYVFKSHTAKEPKVSNVRRLFVTCSIFCACFAIAGTSLTPYTRTFLIQGRTEERLLSEATVEAALATVAGSPDFQCGAPDARPQGHERICQIDGIWLTYQVQDGQVSFEVEKLIPLFGGEKGTMRDVDRLVEDLKLAFADTIDGLEYVEPLMHRAQPQ